MRWKSDSGFEELSNYRCSAYYLLRFICLKEIEVGVQDLEYNVVPLESAYYIVNP